MEQLTSLLVNYPSCLSKREQWWMMVRGRKGQERGKRARAQERASGRGHSHSVTGSLPSLATAHLNLRHARRWLHPADW